MWLNTINAESGSAYHRHNATSKEGIVEESGWVVADRRIK